MSFTTYVEQGIDPSTPAAGRVRFYAKANVVFIIDDLGVVTDLTSTGDADAIHKNVDGEINAIALKASPVSADVGVLEDSADSFSKKKYTLGSAPVGTHTLGGAGHIADTLANVNTKMSDATLMALAGQLGGTAASPDVRGVRTTEGGGTLLTMADIADGELFIRSGTDVAGATLTSLAGGPLSFGDYTLSVTAVTQYLYPNVLDSGLAHTTEVFMSAPRAGTIRNLHIRAVAGTGAATITFTLRKEAAGTALTVGMSNTATTAADTSNSFTVAQGERLSLEVTKSGSVTTALTHIQATVEYAA